MRVNIAIAIAIIYCRIQKGEMAVSRFSTFYYALPLDLLYWNSNLKTIPPFHTCAPNVVLMAFCFRSHLIA